MKLIMMIKCSMEELLLADMLAKCKVTAEFRSKLKDADIKEALKRANKKIRKRKWFENNQYSEEFSQLTKYLKLYSISNQEILLNNLIYRYRSESEHGVLLVTLAKDEVEIGSMSKVGFLAIVVKNYASMLDNVNAIGQSHEVNDMLRQALQEIKPQIQLSYIKDEKIQYIGVIRSFEKQILEEELLSNQFRSVNSRYLRDLLLHFLGVKYE